MEKIKLDEQKIGERVFIISYLPDSKKFELTINGKKIITASYYEYFDIFMKMSHVLWTFYMNEYEKAKSDPTKMEELKKIITL
jgi:hypothetical protein